MTIAQNSGARRYLKFTAKAAEDFVRRFKKGHFQVCL